MLREPQKKQRTNGPVLRNIFLEAESKVPIFQTLLHYFMKSWNQLLLKSPGLCSEINIPARLCANKLYSTGMTMHLV